MCCESLQLLFSSADGEVIAIHYCVKQGADPNIKNSKNNSALLIAANRGHWAVVDALIKYNANVHVCNDDGATPLYQAASNGHGSVVQRLVAANADLEARTKNQSTPLVSAARNGKSDSVLALLELGAKVNSGNGMGATPLHLAAFASHAECVRILLDKGANTKLAIKRGALAGTVAHEVASMGPLVLSTLLLQHDKSRLRHGCHFLYSLVLLNFVQMAKTDEIQRMLQEHQRKAGLFGMILSSTNSLDSSRQVVHSPQGLPGRDGTDDSHA